MNVVEVQDHKASDFSKSQLHISRPRLKRAHILILYTLVFIPHCLTLSHRHEGKGVGYISTGFYCNTRPSCLSHKRQRMEIGSSKVDQILEELKVLTLMETAELVKKIEETFGVSAAPVMQVQAASGPTEQTPEPEEEEEEEPKKKKKTSFEVVLTEVKTEKRMSMFRMLKSLMPDQDLQQIKKIIDNLPFTLNTFSTEKEAEELKKRVEEAGGTINIQ